MGALFVNIRDAEVIRTTLEDMGFPQLKPTPIASNKSTAVGIDNNTINQRRTKEMEMRFYLCQNRVLQKLFCVY